MPALPPRSPAKKPPVSPYQAQYKHRLPPETREKLEKKERLDSGLPDKPTAQPAQPVGPAYGASGRHVYPLMTPLGADLGPDSRFKFDPERGNYRYIPAVPEPREKSGQHSKESDQAAAT